MSVLTIGSAAEPATKPRQVEVGLYVLDITEINEPAGQFVMQVLLGSYWRDPAQAHNGNQPQVWIEDEAVSKASEIWRPMLEFNRTAAPSELEHAILRIHPDGRVDFERQMNVRLSTELNLRKLPFDIQTLQIELESFVHQASEVEFALSANDLRVAEKISLAHWKPGRTSVAVQPYFNKLYDETYSRIRATIEVKRSYHYYVWQMIVPLGIMVGVACAVFFISPSDLADRMNVIIASLLTVVALSFSLHSDLPKIPYLTVIDWLFVLAYIFLGLTIVGMVCTHRLFARDEARAMRLDLILRWGFPLGYLAAAGTVVGLAL